MGQKSRAKRINQIRRGESPTFDVQVRPTTSPKFLNDVVDPDCPCCQAIARGNVDAFGRPAFLVDTPAFVVSIASLDDGVVRPEADSGDAGDLAARFLDLLRPAARAARSNRARQRLVLDGLLAWNLAALASDADGLASAIADISHFVGDAVFTSPERHVAALAEDKVRRFPDDARLIQGFAIDVTVPALRVSLMTARAA